MKKLHLILFSLLFIWACGDDDIPTYLSLELRDDNLYYLDNKPYSGAVEEYFDQTGYTDNDGFTLYYDIPIPQLILYGSFTDGKMVGSWIYKPLRDGGKNNIESFYGKRYAVIFESELSIGMQAKHSLKMTYNLAGTKIVSEQLIKERTEFNKTDCKGCVSKTEAESLVEKQKKQFSQSAFKNYLESLERWAIMRANNDY